MLSGAKKNHGVAAFTTTHIVVPKDFHEIARLRLRKIGEVSAQAEFVKQSRGSGTVRVPTSPHAFTVMLVANDQLVQRRIVELELPAVAQLFNRLNENQVGGARTKTHIRLRRGDKKFSGFKMSGGLQFYFGN